MDGVFTGAQRLYAWRGLEWHLGAGPDGEVRLDGRELGEMVFNLLDNAGKWAAGRVECRWDIADGWLEITVEDDGPGLLPPDAPLPEGAPRPGLGLGLTSNGRILNDWQPMAGSGAVAAKVFVDGNMNGRFDAGEEPIANAGFRVNGNSRQAVRTDARGEALLSRLPPRLHADVALDPGTLEDAQWQPVQPGARILPRSGKVQKLDFPVVLTAEIDGTVYLKNDAGKRGIGNATLQLVDAAGRVVGEARSSSDGYYIVPSVKPGTYTLRIEPEQLRALGLTVDREARITVNAKGDFVVGIDFQLNR